jgi:hypothetical protein
MEYLAWPFEFPDKREPCEAVAMAKHAVKLSDWRNLFSFANLDVLPLSDVLDVIAESRKLKAED